MELKAIIIFLFLVAQSVCGCQRQREPEKYEIKRVVRGRPTTIEEVPYQLQVEKRVANGEYKFFCGGVIIGKSVALTAAHCVNRGPARLYRFISGSTERGCGVPHDVYKLTVHPDYQKHDIPYNYDVAVAEVYPPFEFGPTTKPIKMVTARVFTNEKAIVSGWGRTSSDSPVAENLQKAKTAIEARRQCEIDYESTTEYVITHSMLCTVPKSGSPCVEDAGGPLVVGSRLAGVASFSTCCGTDGRPVVYANIRVLKPWIEGVIDGRA